MSDQDLTAETDDVLLDLLVKQIVEELSPTEQQLLDLNSDATTAARRREFEAAVGVVALAVAFAADGNSPQPLPASLQTSVMRDAVSFFAAPRADVTLLDARRAEPGSRRDTPQPLPSYSAWWVAAACLLVGAIGWLRSPPPVAPAEPVASTPAPSRTATPAEQRRALLAGSSAVTLALGPTQDPAGAHVSGDVVWDAAAQRGYIRFVGLAANDAKLQQYQIWIFDAGRDQRYPVDGGVFDIPAGQSEVIVPIHARISVFTASAFAVTLERAGGVVVSSRDRVVALAKAT